MGPALAYLPEPIKDKHSADGESKDFKYAASSMQGWRTNMEDTHIAITNFDNDPSAALFAVFDGHGGNYNEFYGVLCRS